MKATGIARSAGENRHRRFGQIVIDEVVDPGADQGGMAVKAVLEESRAPANPDDPVVTVTHRRLPLRLVARNLNLATSWGKPSFIARNSRGLLVLAGRARHYRRRGYAERSP